MRVSEKRRISASRETVWAWVCDPARYPEFMDGVSRWSVQGDKNTGSGARWDVRLKVGSAPVGGLVEVVEYDEPGDIAWNSITGVTMRGRWRLRDRGNGVTEVDLRLAYQAPGGLMGLIADRVAAPMVSRSLKRSLRNLQMLVESRPAPTRVESVRQAKESATSHPGRTADTTREATDKSAGRAPAKRTAAKKAPATKAPATKAPAKKAVATKAAATKAPAERSARKATAQKSAATTSASPAKKATKATSGRSRSANAG
jgi:uncharacterized membrane protein